MTQEKFDKIAKMHATREAYISLIHELGDTTGRSVRIAMEDLELIGMELHQFVAGQIAAIDAEIEAM